MSSGDVDPRDRTTRAALEPAVAEPCTCPDGTIIGPDVYLPVCKRHGAPAMPPVGRRAVVLLGGLVLAWLVVLVVVLVLTSDSL